MRKIKNTRTCKGCFNSILKTKKNIEEKKYLQLGITKKEELGHEIIISEDLNIQGQGKTLYLCREDRCIENALKRRIIERYFDISLKEEEKEEIRKYVKKREKEEK